MKIDGKSIAENILNNLHAQVAVLKQKGLTPTLAVIQVGDDPASTAYIRQKQKAAEAIGAKIILSHQSSVISHQRLEKIIKDFNNDPSVHGIILQRPLPGPLAGQSTSLCRVILPAKDVDGFHPNSPYPVPVASAIIKIIEHVFHSSLITHSPRCACEAGHSSLDDVLGGKHIVVIGRGDTAGKPIADMFMKKGYTVSVVHSQTPHPDAITKTADILISCVGKPNVVRRDNIKKGAILISVGITRGSDGKLHGDYEEDQIKDHASLYTPTPGGVGPVNVACLMKNLVQAATKVLL